MSFWVISAPPAAGSWGAPGPVWVGMPVVVMGSAPRGRRGRAGPLRDRGLHGLQPVAVLDRVEPLVLVAHARGDDAVHPEGPGDLVRTVAPVLGAAAHVVPRRGGGPEGELAGAELLEVVRGGHARGVEEVLVLADPVRAGLGALPLRGDAVDGDLGLVRRDRLEVPDLRAELVHQVDVRVQAQVARALDHELALGVAELLLELVHPVPQRAVLGVGRPGPQAQVPVGVGPVAAAGLAPAAGVEGLCRVLRLAGAAPGRGGRVVPVGRADVVPVGAVLGLHLPVAVIGVGRGPAEHLKPLRRLVDQHVDHRGGVPEVLGQRADVGVEAAEQEPAVAVEPRHPDQVVRPVGVEARGVAGALGVLDLEQLAVVAERPAVEGAGERRPVVRLATAEHRPAVRAGVDQAVQLAALVPGDDDGLTADVGREVVARVRHLALVREVDPVALEDVGQLQLEELLVGEDPTVGPVDAGLAVIDDSVGENVVHLCHVDSHGRDLRRFGGWCGPPRVVVPVTPRVSALPSPDQAFIEIRGVWIEPNSVFAPPRAAALRWLRHNAGRCPGHPTSRPVAQGTREEGNVELRQLRYFVTVAQTRHFGEAAQLLHMAQSPLSQAIRQLESQIGATVFTRTTRRVELTPAGETLLRDALRILDSVEAAQTRVRLVESGTTGLLRIGATGLAALHKLPRLARIAAREMPGLELRFSPDLLTPAQECALEENRIDLAVLRPPLRGAGLASRLITRERLVVAVPRSHRLAGEEPVGLVELNDEDFVVYGIPDSVVDTAVPQACLAAGFLPRRTHEAPEISSMLTLVAAGLGVAVLPESARALRVEGVRLVPVSDDVHIDLALAWRRDDSSPALGRILGALEANGFITPDAGFPHPPAPHATP